MFRKIKYYACSNVNARCVLRCDKDIVPIERQRLQENSIEGFHDSIRIQDGVHVVSFTRVVYGKGNQHGRFWRWQLGSDVT